MDNFGKIKNIFSEILVESILTKNDELKKMFKEYIKIVKEDKTLRLQTLAYNNLETIGSDDEKYIDAYITENIKILTSLSNTEKRKSIKKLEKLLENKLVGKIKINYPAELKSLHNNIHKLTTTKYDVDNIIECRNNLNGIILERKIEDEHVQPLVPSKTLTKLSVRKFNEKYESLNEDEKKLVKLLSSSNNELLN